MTILDRRQKAISQAMESRVGWAKRFGQELLGFGMVRMKDDDLADMYMQDKEKSVKDVKDRLGEEEAGRYRSEMERILAGQGYPEDPKMVLPEVGAELPPAAPAPAAPPMPPTDPLAAAGPPPVPPTNGATY